ncbi:unnamed protein product [Jaminaea pallidilutea]
MSVAMAKTQKTTLKPWSSLLVCLPQAQHPRSPHPATRSAAAAAVAARPSSLSPCCFRCESDFGEAVAQRRRTEAQGVEGGTAKLASDQQSVSSSSSSSDRGRSLEYSTSSSTPPFVQTTFDLNLVSTSQVSRIVLGRDTLIVACLKV